MMPAGLTDVDLEPSSRAEAFDPPIFLQPREAKRCLGHPSMSGQVLTRMGSVMVDIQAQEAVDAEIPAVGSGPPR